MFRLLIYRSLTVRIDNHDPKKAYKDFWDWLFRDWNIIFVLMLVMGYCYYLMATSEI